MQRVLVTGATGFIGYELARRLASSGLRPRLLVRRAERGALLRPLGAELVSGDLETPDSLARALDGVDTVFHLAARATFESYRVVRPTIVAGTERLARLAAEAGAERFVFASSLMVYGDRRQPIDADTPAEPVIGYGRAKLEAEASLARIARRTGMKLAVLRLPHVYGARSLLFDHAHRGRIVFAGRGDNLYAHLHVEDAARLLIGCARSGWTGVSPVADDRSASWNELLAVLAAHYPRVKVTRVPAGLARLGAAIWRGLVAPWGRPGMATPDTVRGWNLNLPVRPGLVWKELGLTPVHPTIDVGIPAALDERVVFRWSHPLADPS